MRNIGRSIVIFILLAIFLSSIVRDRYKDSNERRREIPYSDFINKVQAGEVDSVQLTGDVALGSLRTGDQKFLTHLPDDKNMISILRQHHVTLTVKPSFFTGFWGSIVLSVVLPLIFVLALWIIIMRQAQNTGNQALSFGRSKAKRHSDNMPKVTFDDVAGIDEAKEELEEVIEFLKHPEKFQMLGAKIPKGVLLIGPPGCGKTYLARAIAGEANVPFFHISGSDFVEMFVGVGASRVRDLFEQAKASKPCIIFIDEIDAVGRQRGAGLGGGHDEREQTLNQLLVEMDGFEPNAGVIMIAATNRPDVLDPALLRPGRFDRRIVVDNPDAAGRRAILSVHVRGKPLEDEVDLDLLARRTPGFSGADIANLVNEAALLAARRNKKQIDLVDFEDSIERVVAGPERRSRIISDREKKVLAYHEAGHALVSKMLKHSDPVHKVAIVPRGMALGYTMHLPIEDRYIISKAELTDNITSLLGGRVAEEIAFNEITTGAQNDLERATEIARQMVCEFGMNDTLGPLTLGRRHGPVFLGRDLVEDRNYGEEVASAIDKEIRRIVEACYAEATRLLTEHRTILDAIVEALLEKETVLADQLNAIIKAHTTSESVGASAADSADSTGTDENTLPAETELTAVEPALTTMDFSPQ